VEVIENKLTEIYRKEAAVKSWSLWTGLMLPSPLNKVKLLIPSGRTEKLKIVS